MDTATAARRWNVEMARSLPDDGNRYEVVDGMLLVTPAPSWQHQNAGGELYGLLRSYLSDHPIGHAMVAPADVEYDAAGLAGLVRLREELAGQRVAVVLTGSNIDYDTLCRVLRGEL